MKFIKYTLSFSFATLISRVLGYIRDLVIAYTFGVSGLTDAFFIAWRLPNMFRQILGEGSLNAVFVPLFKKLEKENIDVHRFTNSIFTYLSITIFVLTAVFIIFAPYIATIIAPGFVGKEFFDDTVRIIRLVFPYIILVSWVAFFMALLNIKGIFFLPAFTPALLNISFIFSAIFLSQYIDIYALVVGAIIGGILQVAILIKPVFRLYKIRPLLFFDENIKLFFKRLLPTIASFGVTQVSFIVDTVIASMVMFGAVSYLYYANRLLQLPLGIFGIGLGNAVLVSMSEYSLEKDKEKIEKELTTAVKLAFIISIPASVGLILLSHQIIDILFFRGKFSLEDLRQTSLALIGLSTGLVAVILQKPLKSVFFSIEDVKTPLYATFVGVIFSIVCALFFVFVFDLGVFGLALATSVNYFTTVIYLYMALPVKIIVKDTLKSVYKSIIAVSVMTVLIEAVKYYFQESLIIVVISIVIGSAVYFLMLYILKESSLKLIFKR